MTAARSGQGGQRPAIAVIVPFYGSDQEASEMISAIDGLERRPGDEIVLADNTEEGVLGSIDRGDVRVVAAPDEASAYYARNVAAEATENPWLLFTDADCIPVPGLLDAYFSAEIEDACGAVAGEVLSAGTDLISRYADSRGFLSPRSGLRHPYRPAAVTANLLVRRDAYRSIGGFHEGINAGADIDFCWRLQEAGWSLREQPAAMVRHVHRPTLRALAKQAAGYGAGNIWLNRRYPGSAQGLSAVRGLLRAIAGTAALGLTARFERARFKAIDGLLIAADLVGRVRSNVAVSRDEAGKRADVVITVDAFPRLSETFIVEEVRALQRLGHSVRLEAVTRPERPALGATRGLRVNYREDDTLLDRLRCFAWAIARHPLRSLRDRLAAGRWRAGGEEVTHLASIAIPARRLTRAGEGRVHAHFARVAALDGLRLQRLTGVPFSVTAHATHDIFGDPANLEEKLRAAAFVTTGCEYNVRYLRRLLGPDDGARIHEVVMGIDPRRFTRSRPLPNGRVVIGVGRLIETKGFGDLIEAVANLERSASTRLDRLLLVGAGPLQAGLERRASELGISERVEFAGAKEPHEVRVLMQEADMLAMPCVIAADGARDSMPVVVKEAMALEMMVVGTDEVGLPELIRDDWGRLVPPRDPASLAEAIAALLAQPPGARAAMGVSGRDFVLEHCNVDREAAKLAALLGLPARGPGSDHQPAAADGGTSDEDQLNQIVS